MKHVSNFLTIAASKNLKLHLLLSRICIILGIVGFKAWARSASRNSAGNVCKKSKFWQIFDILDSNLNLLPWRELRRCGGGRGARGAGSPRGG